jgi:Thioredoxin
MKSRLPILPIFVLLCCAVIAWNLYRRYAPSAAPTQQAATTPTPANPTPQTTPAQIAPAQPAPDPFKDTSMLKPPAGSPVAIVEFEDMECPLCAHDFPLVRAASQQHNVPLLRHDFPLTEIHAWALDAAITARYLQDSVSPALAEQFRRDIFANQPSISSKDDLTRFTANWFSAHSRTLPFVLDASGSCKREVLADRALGDRLMRSPHTPCLFVVTQTGWTEIHDIAQLDPTLASALASTRKPAA